MLYVLDEPTIGLHPRDNRRLLTALQHLRDLGNTLILVEHDREVIASADYLLDFGPGAGDRGGEITAEGTPKQVHAIEGVADRTIPLRARRPSRSRPIGGCQPASRTNRPALTVQGGTAAQPAATSTWPSRSAPSSP